VNTPIEIQLATTLAATSLEDAAVRLRKAIDTEDPDARVLLFASVKAAIIRALPIIDEIQMRDLGVEVPA
jgi:hypothetical protein